MPKFGIRREYANLIDREAVVDSIRYAGNVEFTFSFYPLEADEDFVAVVTCDITPLPLLNGLIVWLLLSK